jgi:hypothetical protein
MQGLAQPFCFLSRLLCACLRRGVIARDLAGSLHVLAQSAFGATPQGRKSNRNSRGEDSRSRSEHRSSPLSHFLECPNNHSVLGIMRGISQNGRVLFPFRPKPDSNSR